MTNKDLSRYVTCGLMAIALIIESGVAVLAKKSDTQDKDKWYSNAKPTRVRAQYHFDERGYNTLGLYIWADKLPLGLSLFGFTDLHGSQKDYDHRADATNSFSEYRLSHYGIDRIVDFLPGKLGLQLEYNDVTGGSGDILRLGLTYKHPLPIPEMGLVGGKPGWVEWRGFPVETDHDRKMAAVTIFVPFHDRVNILSFIDLNILPNASDRWVTETQLNVRLWRNMWGVLEYRYNGFQEAIVGLDGEGWAPGVRIDF